MGEVVKSDYFLFTFSVFTLNKDCLSKLFARYNHVYNNIWCVYFQGGGTEVKRNFLSKFLTCRHILPVKMCLRKNAFINDYIDTLDSITRSRVLKHLIRANKSSRVLGYLVLETTSIKRKSRILLKAESWPQAGKLPMLL